MRSPVPYPPISRHAVIGDRRTAALVAADGTVDWLCLRDYDDDPVFAALVDARRGGLWRMGPAAVSFGAQRYVADTAVLTTTWALDHGRLELTDAMPWPGEERAAADVQRRVVLRRLRCTGGRCECVLDFSPRDVLTPDVAIEPVDGGLGVRLFGRRDIASIGVWSTHRLDVDRSGTSATARFTLREGEAAWMVAGPDERPADWSETAANATLESTVDYWRRWMQRFDAPSARSPSLRRSLVTTHLLAYAPSGAMVAAPTFGLPERVGGERNYDYRFAWVRDASLSATSLCLVGDTESAEHYLRWLSGLRSETDAPLQVAYDVHGNTKIPPSPLRGAEGYRGSTPVVLGNRAYKQRQLGSLGYLAECMFLALDRGMNWRSEDSAMLARAARYVGRSWHEPDSGIWELQEHQQFVGSKVMSWVVLDRAVNIGRRLGCFDGEEMDRWRAIAGEIRETVLSRGYGEELGAFRQRYDEDTVDAASLLVPLVRFLPADDPRVQSTLDRIDDVLGFDGLLYRFVPRETQGEQALPLGQYEGAFLPCSFWMATARALAGQIDRAEALVERIERLAGDVGLFPEEVDARTGEHLGNFPLLFTHVEHVRAVVAIDHAKRERAGAGSRASFGSTGVGPG